MEKIITCTVCPIGCEITVKGSNGTVESLEGHQCKRGIAFATAEFIAPVRLLTTTVVLSGGSEPLVPVRSDKPIPKEKLFECMAEIRKISVNAPILHGQIIIPNIIGLDCNIIASRAIEANL